MSVRSLARVGWVALAAGLAVGCELVTTVESAIPDSEATFDSRLLGTWISGSRCADTSSCSRRLRSACDPSWARSWAVPA